MQKKCKLRIEAESAHEETVAQRASFADLEESKSRLIPELEELITCSYQSGTKFDQASLQVESGHETGRSVLVQEVCAFPACSTPDHKSKSFNKVMRDDQQSHYLPEGGGLRGCRTQDLV